MLLEELLRSRAATHRSAGEIIGGCSGLQLFYADTRDWSAGVLEEYKKGH